MIPLVGKKSAQNLEIETRTADRADIGFITAESS
jgi:hypothetical protein